MPTRILPTFFTANVWIELSFSAHLRMHTTLSSVHFWFHNLIALHPWWRLPAHTELVCFNAFRIQYSPKLSAVWNTQPQLLCTHCTASLYTAPSYVYAASTQPQLLCTCKQKQAKAGKCKQKQAKANKSKQKQKQPKANKSKQKQSRGLHTHSQVLSSKANDCIHTPDCFLAMHRIAYTP